MMFLAGYAGESIVRFIDSIAPPVCRYFSNYLRQYTGFFIPPGIWLVLTALVVLVGFYWLLVAARGKPA